MLFNACEKMSLLKFCLFVKIIYKSIQLSNFRLRWSLKGQKKEPVRVLLNGGPGETRTLTPKALDPKSSASTNFATGPIVSAL